MDAPYTWRAWTRDGKTLMRGDSYKGKPALSPMALLREDPDCLVALTLMPDAPGWPAAEVVLERYQRLEYHIVRESVITPDEKDRETSRREFVRCCVLGLIDQNTGIKTHLILHPGFSVQIMTGKFEALLSFKEWQAKVAKQHGLLNVAKMPTIIPGRN